MFFFSVSAGLAVTRILPFSTRAWKEWIALGAGASSAIDHCQMFGLITLTDICVTNISRADVEAS